MDTRSIWHPWQEMRRLQREMDHLVNDLAPAWRWPLAGDYPPLNVTRTDTGLTVEALCPGVNRDTLDITVVGDALTIRCERKPPADVPAERYHRRERPMGTFTRTLVLGERCDPDKTEASVTNGILRVQLARSADSAPKKIPVHG
jgi:HSP20 family protein